MIKRCATYILILLLATQAVAVSERDIFPESDVKRFKSLTDFQLSAGTAEGQILYWDEDNNKWVPSETPPNSDEILFWDDSASAIMFLTPGAGVSITNTTLFFDAPELDALTWSDGLNASNTWTFDVSGTDHTMTAGDGSMTFSHEIIALRGLFGGITDPINPGSTCIGRWKLEDNAADSFVVDDVGGNTGEAQLSNSPTNTSTLNTTGKLGDAFNLAGNNRVYWSGNIPELDFTTECSVVFWFQTSTIQSVDLVDCSASDNDKWAVGLLNDSGSLYWAINQSIGQTAISTDQGDGYWSDGAWHLVVATYDRSGGAERLKLYVDNSKIATDGGADTDISTPMINMQLGTNTSDANFDNFMLYNEALGEGEISALWNSGAGNEDAGFASVTLATMVGSTDIFTFYHASDIGKDLGVEGDIEVHGNVYGGGIFATDFGNYVGFDAPTSLTSNTSWTLPADDGSANETFITNGSEVLSFGGHDDLAGFVSAEHLSLPNTVANVLSDGDFGSKAIVTTGTLGAGAITGTSLTDGTATLDDGSLTSAVNGTFSGTVQAEQLTSTDDITMQGHLLTLGDNSVTDIIISFDANTNDGTITFDESDGEYDFGSSDITTTGTLSVGDIGSNLVPDTDATYDIGTGGGSPKRWKDGRFSGVVYAGTGQIESGFITDSGGSIGFGDENISIGGTLDVNTSDNCAFRVWSGGDNTFIVDTIGTPHEITTHARWILEEGLITAGSGVSGVLILGGYGGTYNEQLSLDFETTSNVVGISSATNVGDIDWDGINLIDVGAITCTTLQTHPNAITSGSEISYKTATISPANVGIIEVISNAANPLGAAVTAGINIGAFFDPTQAVAAQYAGAFNNSTTATLSSGITTQPIGLFGGCLTAIDNNGVGSVGTLRGLAFSCGNNANFDGGEGKTGNYALNTRGLSVVGYLGWTGKTISNLADIENYGGYFQGIMGGTYNSTRTDGVNYGVYAKTTNSFEGGTGDVTSYGVYLDAAASDSNIGGGGVLTSWGLYGATDVDSFLAGDLAFGQTDKAERIASDADGTLDLYAGTSIELHDATNIGDGTNELQIEGTGDAIFVGSAGLPYGEIYCKDNVAQTTLNSAAKVQVTDFDTNGASNNSTPDHTNDHITITKAGMYLCTISISLVNVAAQAHTIDLLLYKNNGATAFNNVHGHRDMTGGGGDKGSMSLSGIIDLAVNDTIELWADTDAAANRDVIFEDVTMSLVQIGGT